MSSDEGQIAVSSTSRKNLPDFQSPYNDTISQFSPHKPAPDHILHITSPIHTPTDNTKSGQNYLFAPPNYQPTYTSSNFSTRFENIASLTPDHVLCAQQDDNAKPFKSAHKCCGFFGGIDYIDYTILRFLWTFRQVLAVIAVTISGFLLQERYSSFYLVFPLFLMSTNLTVGQSLISAYSTFTGLFIGLTGTWVVFYLFSPLSALGAGLCIPIFFIICAIVLTTRVNPGMWKILTAFFPVFLLLGWSVKATHAWVETLFEMVGITLVYAFGFILLPYPLQTNHHVDNLVRKVLKNSARVTYLVTKSFLNERYNKTRLLDYAKNPNQKGNRALESKRIKSKVEGTLFEAHIKGLQRYNELQVMKQNEKRARRDQRKRQLPSGLASIPSGPSSTLSTTTTPSTAANKSTKPIQTSRQHISHDIYHDLHHQGGHVVYAESFSDVLSSTSTDDDMYFHLEPSSISGSSCLSTTATSDGEDDEGEVSITTPLHSRTNSHVSFAGDKTATTTNINRLTNTKGPLSGLKRNKRLTNSVNNLPALDTSDTESILEGDNEDDDTQMRVEIGEIFSSHLPTLPPLPTTINTQGLPDLPNLSSSRIGGNATFLQSTSPQTNLGNHATNQQHFGATSLAGFPEHASLYTTVSSSSQSDSDASAHDTPFFDDLYVQFGRKYAPEHPQGSVHATRIPKRTKSDQAERKSDHKLKRQEETQDQRESDINLHIPYPQMYFNHLLDIVVEIETDLDILRGHVVPLNHESTVLRLLMHVLCCCFGKYSRAEMEPIKTHAFSGDFHSPTSAKTLAQEVDPKRQGGFYPQPHWLYPNIFTTKSFISIPYNGESLGIFIAEMLLAVTNIRGMITSLHNVPHLSKSGLMLYHYWTSFIRHDMKRLVWLQKAFITNIINQNEDVRAMDSSFIHAMFTIAAQVVDDGNVNYTVPVPINPTSLDHKSASNTIPTPNTIPISNTSPQQLPQQPQQPQQQGKRRSGRLSPVHQAQDLFTVLYHTLTKYHLPGEKVKPTEKEIRNMSFIPGTFAALLHQCRNFWLQQSRIRQAAFYGIRKTKYKRLVPPRSTPNNQQPKFQRVDSVSISSLRLNNANQPSFVYTNANNAPNANNVSNTIINNLPQQATNPSENSFDDVPRYILKTRKIAPAVFQFATDISQEHLGLEDNKTPIYDMAHADFKDHSSTLLNSQFAHLYSCHHVHRPKPGFKPNPTPNHQNAHHKKPKHKKDQIKTHFSITLEDVTLFNNFMFNFDRFQTRLVSTIFPVITPHLYPISLLTSMIPSSLSIPHSASTISGSHGHHHTELLGDALYGTTDLNVEMLARQNSIANPQKQHYHQQSIHGSTVASVQSLNLTTSIGSPTPSSASADLLLPQTRVVSSPPATSTNDSQLPTTTITEADPAQPAKPLQQTQPIMRATIIKPAPVPSWYTLPNPLSTQSFFDFFTPHFVMWLWAITSLLLFPQRVAKVPQRDISILRHEDTALDGATDDDKSPPPLQVFIPIEHGAHEDDVVELNLDDDDDATAIEETTGAVSPPQPQVHVPFEPAQIQIQSFPINTNRHFHHQTIQYTELDFAARVKKAWILHIKPGPAEIKVYKTIYRSILLITISSFPAIIPSVFQAKQSPHWTALAVALLMGETVGTSFTSIINRVLAQIIGAFYAYFLVKLAVYADPDGDFRTGFESQSVVVAGLALLTAYFSWARSSRTKNTAFTATLMVAACVIGLGSIGTNAADTNELVLHRLEANLFAGVLVILGCLTIYPVRGINDIYNVLAKTIQGLSSILTFNSQLLTQSGLYQYAHGSFNSFGPTFFPIVSIQDDKAIELELTEEEYQEVVKTCPTTAATASSTWIFDSLRRKITLLQRCDDKIYDHAVEATNKLDHQAQYPNHTPHHTPHHSPKRHHPPSYTSLSTPDQDKKSNQTITTRLQIYHPFDSRSHFFYSCINSFTAGGMNPATIGLKLLPYPDIPPSLPHHLRLLNQAHNAELTKQHQLYNTIRNTNYLNFLFIYNSQIKARSADLRGLGLTLGKLIELVETESTLSVLAVVRKTQIPLLKSVVAIIFTLIRLSYRFHEVLYCYQFILISLNEYYNSTGCDMNSSFKSIVQLNYETYLKQQHEFQQEQRKKQELAQQLSRQPQEIQSTTQPPTPTFLSRTASTALSSPWAGEPIRSPRHYHDDLVLENQDLTTLLITHAHDILQKKTPQLSQIDQFIHLKTKTLQVNKMLMAESLPLMITFNHTTAVLLSGTLQTLQSLAQQTIVPTTFSMAWNLVLSQPQYHTNNNVQYQLYLTHKRRLLKLEHVERKLSLVQARYDQQQQHIKQQELQSQVEPSSDNIMSPGVMSVTFSTTLSTTTSASQAGQTHIPLKNQLKYYQDRQSILKKDVVKHAKTITNPSSFQLFLDDEVEYLNTPYAYGVQLSLFGFNFGSCCNRQTKYTTIPNYNEDRIQVPTPSTPATPVVAPTDDLPRAHPDTEPLFQTPAQSPVDIEMGEIKTHSQQQQQQQQQQYPTSSAISSPSPQLPLNLLPFELPDLITPSKTKFPNPYYDRSARLNQQRQYIFQLISCLRQVKLIFQEITYQRFHGGRDGYYTTQPSPLVNIEHSFLALVSQCPQAFIELLSQLNRLENSED